MKNPTTNTNICTVKALLMFACSERERCGVGRDEDIKISSRIEKMNCPGTGTVLGNINILDENFEGVVRSAFQACPYKNNTKNQTLALLNGSLKLALQKPLDIPRWPMERLTGYLSPKDASLLLDALWEEDHLVHWVSRLVLRTAYRIECEALNIDKTWLYPNRPAGCWWIKSMLQDATTKRHKRSIPILDEELYNWIATLQRPAYAYFENGAPNRIRGVLKKVSKRIGIQHVRPHLLRHTAITWTSEYREESGRGISKMSWSYFAGHSRCNTARYTHDYRADAPLWAKACLGQGLEHMEESLGSLFD